ncbi:MAG: cytochrome c [Bacteroidetes bacterium]|nr:cytochrome c [Bacteroidota bacterium]
MVNRILTLLLIAFSCYSLWVYLYCDEKRIAPDAIASRGWKIWQEKNCQSCHQVYGLGGYMGPDLTNIAALRTEQHLRTFIKYGTGKMPNFQLSDDEVNNLVAWLIWVNKTGKAKVPASAVHWTGTYNIERQE